MPKPCTDIFWWASVLMMAFARYNPTRGWSATYSVVGA